MFEKSHDRKNADGSVLEEARNLGFNLAHGSRARVERTVDVHDEWLCLLQIYEGAICVWYILGTLNHFRR